MRRPAWVLLGLVLLFGLGAGRAQAHPLGNFTINHLAQVTPARGSIAVDYTLDIAEIPTFQIMHATDQPWDAAQLARWAQEESALVTAGLQLSVDGVPLPLAIQGGSARLRPGAGGLPTLYWRGRLTAAVGSGDHRVRIEDRVYADRQIGWKDVVVAPANEPTHALTSYPSALVAAPRRNDVAEFTLSPAGTASRVSIGGDEAETLSSPVSLVRSSYLSDLFARSDTSFWLVALTALVAFGLGALHGLEPGHGKALLAFTLVGARATVKQAGILAIALTFAHTVAVLLLGVALLFLADFASESIFSWIALISGAAVAIIGARALNTAFAHARHSHDHAHGLAPGGKPLRFSSAVIAAMSGGIAPCPAAIVVLLTAFRLHKVGYGIAVIVIFSLGLAAVLTAIGIAVVRGAAWLGGRGRFDRLARYAPFVTATVISLVGSFMVAQAFVAQGVHVPVAAIAALTLLAIAGYAFVPAHTHGSSQTV